MWILLASVMGITTGYSDKNKSLAWNKKVALHATPN